MRLWLFRQSAALPQSVRFLFAGGLAAAVNWLVRFPLSTIMPFPAAVVTAAVIGMAVGFTLYRIFVFPGSPRDVWRQLRDFVLINLVTMVVVAIAAFLIRNLLLPYMQLEVAEAVSHAIGIAIGAVLNYAGHGMITFQNRHSPSAFPPQNSKPAGLG
jgi:energy-coupling factor transport system substrate-specific component